MEGNLPPHQVTIMDFNARTFLINYLGLPDGVLVSELAQQSEIKVFDRKEQFQKIGEVYPSLDILVDGLVRGFFLDRGGKEITDCFDFEPGIPLVSSFELGQPAVMNMEALEPTKVLAIPLEELQKIQMEPSFMGVYIHFLTRSLKRHWENKVMVAQYTSKDRYTWFLEKYPGVVDRVNHRYVASFLGMTPVTLARIRRVARDGNASTVLDDIPINEGSKQDILL